MRQGSVGHDGYDSGCQPKGICGLPYNGEGGLGGGWQICFTKPTAGLPLWDSGDLRSTGNPASAAFTLYKLQAITLSRDDTGAYTASSAEYGLQGIGCFANNGGGGARDAHADAHYGDLTNFNPQGMHMPYEFGCQMYNTEGRGDVAHDLGTSTGWTDLMYYSYAGNSLDGMLANGVPTNPSADHALSPVCAFVAGAGGTAQYRAGVDQGADRPARTGGLECMHASSCVRVGCQNCGHCTGGGACHPGVDCDGSC